MKNSNLKISLLVVILITLLAGCHKNEKLPVYTNSIGMKMIKIPAGSFMMGDSSGQWDEVPVHKVKILKSFFMSRTEITGKQFRQFKKDYGFASEKYAIGVDWYEANEFCKWLSKKEGKNYRLPTEAEWEYVCKNRDKWGVENMLDSTLEWCYDWYGPYVDSTQVNPVGVEQGIAKVVRGGLPDVFVKKYSYPEKFYYRPSNRAGMAPNFKGFTVPLIKNKNTPEVNNTVKYKGLAGIVYDDLKMKKPLRLYSIPLVNSSSLKWILMNNWTAKWLGSIKPVATGNYTFIIKADNRVSMSVAGKTIISGNGKDKILHSAVLHLKAGERYPIKIKYLHNGGKSFLKLYWSKAEGKKEIIPPNVFSFGNKDKNEIESEYKEGIFARYVKPSISFRIVQAPELKSKPTTYTAPFVEQCVKTKGVDLKSGPNLKKPYFRKRFLHSVPPDKSSKKEIVLSGLHPSLGGHNHHSSIVVCPNGDLLAVYFSSVYEDAPEVLLMGSRLRYGSDEWEMPTPILDLPDVQDGSPLLWRDGNTIYLFWGNIHLKGGYPFQWVQSTDNGATFSKVHYPKITSVVDGFAPQPITSVIKDKDGTIYLACDGVGAHSLLWASKDNMKTWFDTGGRTGGRHTAIVLLKNGNFFGLGGKKSDIDGFMPISVSSDKGKTWSISKSVFPCLGGGQRPALIRLKSGCLLYAGDFQRKDGFQPKGIKEHGAFVALSSDEGKTWRIKKLPGTLISTDKKAAAKMGGGTLGYVSLAQSENGMIHLITSKNSPALHFEFNEAWILDSSNTKDYSGIMNSKAHKIFKLKTYTEKYPDGKIRCKYSGGIANDGRFLLDGKEEWFYENGKLKYTVNYKLGKRVGAEEYYSKNGKIKWGRDFSNNVFTWIQYWRNGNKKSESHWKNFHCDGVALLWNRAGTLIQKGIFVDGVLKNETYKTNLKRTKK